MDVKLESLIEKIKKDGVEEAKKLAQQIVDEAGQEAARILDNAKNEAARITAKAGQEAAQFKKNAKTALNQAARDLVLMVREKLVSLFDSVLKRDLQTVLTPDFLKEVIIKIVEAWQPKQGQVLEVVASSEDKKKLRELILSQIRKELKNKIVIKTSTSVSKGFRIGIEGEEMHYDFSDESIKESLKVLLNPALAEILDSNG